MNGWLIPGFSLLLLMGAGYVYVRSLVVSPPWYLALALSHLVGAAALGLGATLGLAVTSSPSLVGGAFGLAGCVMAGLWIGRGSCKSNGPRPVRAEAEPRLSWWETALLILLAIGVFTAVARLALLPLDWDGWAIWQFKAKALVDGSLRRFLTSADFGFAHPDYPLLNPTLTWWLSPWSFSAKIAQFSCYLFFLDLLVIFYALARTRMSRSMALTGCVVLVSWPLVMKHSVSGFSDLALAAYVLALVVFLSEKNLALAVPCLIGAVLTKNEGLFTLVGAIAAGAFVSLQQPTRSSPTPGARTFARWAPLFWMTVAGGGTVAIWGVVKRQWGLIGDLLDTNRWPANLVEAILHRIPTVAIGFLNEALAVGPRYPGWGLFWPIAIAGFYVAIRRRRWDTGALWIMAAAHLAGAATAYLLTPLDPALHISRSLDRLLLQIAPTILLAALTAITPGFTGIVAKAAKREESDLLHTSAP